ncbi:putative membrane protein SirB2 [Microbacterium ginsengiterrae]|uniref:Putative membrane protein SirB2 n=1 Tax=Microbacterium ginsengiterrae TaxID=546115 RepID=A0A7W9CC07_9MICO|nr:Pr6Pr family membrane protein [Microbacterium ginsengiterrae]MBB5742800.1 putative membrane protein SirB2 [Microbacterium ginsengiterrae]
MKTWWPYLRLAAAALGAAAIVRQLALAITNAMAAETPWGSHLPTVIANFFSYFTILSNLLAVIALVIGGVWMLRTRRSATAEPAWMGTLLACASTYMIVTGIVYNLLLRGISIAGISDVWTNETLHVVIPLVMLADVLLAPRRRALPWGALLVAVTFPIVWAVYTLLRANLITGPATGNPWWYPYPFLDPHLQGGYLGVIGYIVGIAAAIVAVAAGVVWVGRRRGARVYRNTV